MSNWGSMALPACSRLETWTGYWNILKYELGVTSCKFRVISCDLVTASCLNCKHKAESSKEKDHPVQPIFNTLKADPWGQIISTREADHFWCALPPNARYTWLYKNIPTNQCWIFRVPSVFYFSDNSLVLCYSPCFFWYSHYGDSSSSKKLNGHKALESMSLLGAPMFLSKQHIS